MDTMLTDATIKWKKCEWPWEQCSWVKVHFAKPVVATSIFLHLNSDGLNQYLYTSLIDTEDKEHPLTEEYQVMTP